MRNSQEQVHSEAKRVPTDKNATHALWFCLASILSSTANVPPWSVPCNDLPIFFATRTRPPRRTDSPPTRRDDFSPSSSQRKLCPG
ncbi:hypothetical protein E2C01_027847 [Portunus trituberculatus]|uniref:Uncharacterized protein n=1 Tax=Portunus trituberculatus TaxID=210409 RepID=A0A5B7EM01_PORTR|nr:hypothetical protein [Portunus trituberculatus]